MDSIREYLLSVTAAAIVCCIARNLTAKSGSISAIVKMLTGLMMTIVILTPAVHLSFDTLTLYTNQLTADAQNASYAGQVAAENEMKQLISTQTEAYILKRAQQLGVQLEIEVFLEDLIPASVRITGAAAPYTKLQLTRYISENLGIPSEAQHWIG